MGERRGQASHAARPQSDCPNLVDAESTVVRRSPQPEEAALRRFAVLSKSARLLARFMDVGYRNPCMAGDNLRIVLQAFALRERLGAVGAFVTDDEARLRIAGARPRSFVKMLFES